jgi:hypothetical protein
VVWGGLILVTSLMRGGPQGSGAYAAGQTGASVLGVLLLIIGAITVSSNRLDERQYS